MAELTKTWWKSKRPRRLNGLGMGKALEALPARGWMKNADLIEYNLGIEAYETVIKACNAGIREEKDTKIKVSSDFTPELQDMLKLAGEEVTKIVKEEKAYRKQLVQLFASTRKEGEAAARQYKIHGDLTFQKLEKLEDELSALAGDALDAAKAGDEKTLKDITTKVQSKHKAATEAAKEVMRLEDAMKVDAKIAENRALKFDSMGIKDTNKRHKDAPKVALKQGEVQRYAGLWATTCDHIRDVTDLSAEAKALMGDADGELKAVTEALELLKRSDGDLIEAFKTLKKDLQKADAPMNNNTLRLQNAERQFPDYARGLDEAMRKAREAEAGGDTKAVPNALKEQKRIVELAKKKWGEYTTRAKRLVAGDKNAQKKVDLVMRPIPIARVLKSTDVKAKYEEALDVRKEIAAWKTKGEQYYRAGKKSYEAFLKTYDV